MSDIFARTFMTATRTEFPERVEAGRSRVGVNRPDPTARPLWFARLAAWIF